MEDCGDNPFTQGKVCAKIMYQELLTDEVNVDYLLVTVKQINDKFKIELFDREFITNEQKNVERFLWMKYLSMKYQGYVMLEYGMNSLLQKKKFNCYDFSNNEFYNNFKWILYLNY